MMLLLFCHRYDKENIYTSAQVAGMGGGAKPPNLQANMADIRNAEAAL